LWPRARLDDGALEVVALPLSGPLDAVKLAAKLRAGEHLELDGVVALRTDRIEITAEPAVEFNVDGELFGLTTPAVFEVAGSLRVLLPAL
jgi:diacylglycerol kinase (ATP)